jgi:hypothetical protein
MSSLGGHGDRRLRRDRVNIDYTNMTKLDFIDPDARQIRTQILTRASRSRQEARVADFVSVANMALDRSASLTGSPTQAEDSIRRGRSAPNGTTPAAPYSGAASSISR